MSVNAELRESTNVFELMLSLYSYLAEKAVPKLSGEYSKTELRKRTTASGGMKKIRPHKIFLRLLIIFH